MTALRTLCVWSVLTHPEIQQFFHVAIYNFVLNVWWVWWEKENVVLSVSWPLKNTEKCIYRSVLFNFLGMMIINIKRNKHVIEENFSLWKFGYLFESTKVDAIINSFKFNVMQTFSFRFFFINLLCYICIFLKKPPLFSFVIFLFIHSFNVFSLGVFHWIDHSRIQKLLVRRRKVFWNHFFQNQTWNIHKEDIDKDNM